MTMRKGFRMLMLLCAVAGGVTLVLDMFNLINISDLLQMYSLSLISVGITIFLVTTEYYRVSDEVQARLKVQQQKLFTKAERDYRREERKTRRAAKKRS